MYEIQEISAPMLAFPASVKHLMPKYKDIPDEFKDWNNRNKWSKLVTTWFFRGLKSAKWTPKPGVDTNKALRHVGAIMGSFEPKHEHKEAACAFLLSEWFEDVQYEAADK